MKIYKAGVLSNLIRKLKNLQNKKYIWDSTDNFQKRKYLKYEDYVAHQISKLKYLNLTEYNLKFKNVLLDRYKEDKSDISGKNVLCLGARSGAECQAFIELGGFSVGIDLNPGVSNPYVVTGDFHNLQFSDASVDFVYTNALDHTFDLEKVINEVSRVIKPKGIFYAEIVKGTNDDDGRAPGEFESAWWDSANSLINKIESLGFISDRRSNFSFPWNGVKVSFKKVKI